VWTIFTANSNSGSLPHSLSNLEILWEATTRGEELCHARLRHSGIQLDSQQEEEIGNIAATTTAAAATAARHRLYKAMNESLFKGLQLG